MCACFPLRQLLLSREFVGSFFRYTFVITSIGVGDGGQRDTCPPPKKKWEKYFSGNYYVNLNSGIFPGKNHVKFAYFVNFSGKYQKNLGIVSFSGKNHLKFGHFVNFSYTFFGQKFRAPPPKVDSTPTPMITSPIFIKFGIAIGLFNITEVRNR